jgi:hypothetical protein
MAKLSYVLYEPGIIARFTALVPKEIITRIPNFQNGIIPFSSSTKMDLVSKIKKPPN